MFEKLGKMGQSGVKVVIFRVFWSVGGVNCVFWDVFCGLGGVEVEFFMVFCSTLYKLRMIFRIVRFFKTLSSVFQ